MSIGGLIAAALGGAAEGYGKGAEMEMKKQSELDLRKQLMDAETERQLRVDEIKRGRDVSDRLTEETRTRSPEYLGAVAKADADKFKALIAAGVPEAKAEAMVAEGKAAAKTREALAPINAKAGDVEFEAGKGLEGKKATAAVAAKILETKTLSESDDFIKGETKLSMAKNAATIEAQRLKNEGYLSRSTGGAGGKLTVKKTFTGEDGSMMAIMSDGSPRDLGIKSADYNKAIAKQIDTMTKNDPYKFGKLTEADKRKQAEERLRGQLVVPSSGKDLTGLNDPKYLRQRDATAD